MRFLFYFELLDFGVFLGVFVAPSFETNVTSSLVTLKKKRHSFLADTWYWVSFRLELVWLVFASAKG